MSINQNYIDNCDSLEGKMDIKVNYYKCDNDMAWLAAQVFSDEHFGDALTNDELNKRIKLEEEYKDEIGLVKELVKNNPNFENLSYENKINFVANMIVGLHNKREENKRKQR